MSPCDMRRLPVHDLNDKTKDYDVKNILEYLHSRCNALNYSFSSKWDWKGITSHSYVYNIQCGDLYYSIKVKNPYGRTKKSEHFRKLQILVEVVG